MEFLDNFYQNFKFCPIFPKTDAILSVSEYKMLLIELRKRATELKQYISKCEWFLKKAPPGKLRVTETQNRIKFYIRKSNTDTNGKYLSIAKESKLIIALTRKDYYQKALESAREELEQVEKLLRLEESQPIATIYSKMRPATRALVEPFEEPMEERIKRWESVQPDIKPPKEGSYLLLTKRGEYVRSKAEYNIANALYANKIPYKYEPSYMAKDGTYSRPDFQVMNPTTGETLYWEHFGMLDRPSYVKDMVDKLGGYEESELYPGKGLIVTFDDGSHPLTQAHIQQIIDDLLK